MSSEAEQRSARNRCTPLSKVGQRNERSVDAIALLGKQDQPTDGVRDYCELLSQAFARRGGRLEIAALRWEMHGWRKSLASFWKESRGWKEQIVMLQYTALMWSRRGFPFGALVVLAILKIRAVKLCVVFHDAGYAPARGLIRRLRVAFQDFTIRMAFRAADLPVLTVPASHLDSLPWNSKRGVFIPVGANFPSTPLIARDNLPEVPTVAVFGVTEGAHNFTESRVIAHAMKGAAERITNLRLNVFGRGALAAENTLRTELAGSNVDILVEGVLAPGGVRERLSRADVLLFVRGGISSRRGSAIAGIACGLPVAGYRGAETAPPITEAGVELVENGDCEALARALAQILTDAKLYRKLCQRSAAAGEKYFSWDAIASQFVEAFSSSAWQGVEKYSSNRTAENIREVGE